MPADSNAPANRGVERLKRYHLLWCTDHRVPMLTREEDLHEAVVVDLSLEVRDGLRNHVVDLIRVRVRVRGRGRIRVRVRVRIRVRVRVRVRGGVQARVQVRVRVRI